MVGAQWNDWQWQLTHAITDVKSLEKRLSLTDDERCGLERASEGVLSLRISPYYLSLINGEEETDPIRIQCVPSGREAEEHELLFEDPLAEAEHEVAPYLIRRYPDRVLLITTERCATHCRHCTRRRLIGRSGVRSLAELEPAFQWIERHREVQEVLISGGDPLLGVDEWFDAVLSRLRSIGHVLLLRVGTRTPVTLPQRVTAELCALLRRFAPIHVTTHFNHPRELTDDARRACESLVDVGVPVANQAVLLKGVNDSVTVQRSLSLALLAARVRPYYLMQCDAVRGTSHLRVSVRRGMQIMAALRGTISGLGIPTYVLDLPGGAGKVPLVDSYIVGREGEKLLLRGPRGQIARYIDPPDEADDGETDCR